MPDCPECLKNGTRVEFRGNTDNPEIVVATWVNFFDEDVKELRIALKNFYSKTEWVPFPFCTRPNC